MCQPGSEQITSHYARPDHYTHQYIPVHKSVFISSQPKHKKQVKTHTEPQCQQGKTNNINASHWEKGPPPSRLLDEKRKQLVPLTGSPYFADW